MKPIDIKPVTDIRAVRQDAARSAKTQSANAAPAKPQAAAAGNIVAVSNISAGKAAPVDNDRVQQIRDAIESGSYPIIPAQIADAIIAAGYLLLNEKKA